MVSAMTATAILFPGQGSLTADSPADARGAWPELVEQAAALLGDDPFERATDSTAYAQPAIFVASMAAWRERADGIDDVCAFAGHSLGELSALAAAGAIPVDDALRLVVLRGRLMADAAEAVAGDGGMLALLGGTPEAAADLAAAHGLTIANDNAPGQVVLSGERERLKDLSRVARSEGFKSMVLDVPGAFHSPAIAAAEQPFLGALLEIEWQPTGVPVVSGLTASPFGDVPLELARALVSPVRWREVMGVLWALGAREFVDVGPGHVLDRLVGRNLPLLEEHALAG
jgi:malonyl CoA-acyl carrier protein transacylase